MNENENLKYPVDTSYFSGIRKEGLLYVDKTRYIHDLVTSGKYYFLARPRRFGKSMLLSTLHEYFKGNRTLFKDLEIDRLQPGEWKKYPVIHLDLSGIYYREDNDFSDHVKRIIHTLAKNFEVDLSGETIGELFYSLIVNINLKSSLQVVILIDEYDDPLTKTIDRPEIQHIFREQLQAFYAVLKKADPYIQFCMLTGISRYGEVSVFSGINNLNDISFDDRYAGICGITEEELARYYDTGIKILAAKEKISYNSATELLKYNYDGYHFSKCLLDVYNPYSINLCLSKSEISDYWCRSGAPELLAKTLMSLDYDLDQLNGTLVDESDLSYLSIYNSDPVPLFFQTGYLTIKKYHKEDNLFTIGYPNREVENGILNNILKVYVPEQPRVASVAKRLQNSLQEGEPCKFIEILKAYLSGIPSRLKSHISRYENYYHTIFYCLTSLIGMKVEAEYNTSEGFIDLLIKTNNYIYVIELKINGNAEDAMRQIEQKHYSSQFSTDTRQLIEIGIGFSKQTATISDYKIVRK